MSRIGKEPIVVPKEVKITLEGRLCRVEAAKGKLELAIPEGISLVSEEGLIKVTRKDDSKPLKSLHGTIRVLISNMVKGVTEGFKKELEIIGVGYKALLKGKTLVLNIGFSHPIEIVVPEEIKVTVQTPTRIVAESIDKQKVGEFCARIRKIYPPEPYKGKGIRYFGEEVRKKLGKALAK